MRQIFFKVLRIILLVVVAVVAALQLSGVWIAARQGTNVAFRASDGTWSDQEVLFKGRNFGQLVVSFWDHKMCESPTAELQRTTATPNFLSFSWWYDDFTQEKWLVPYHDPSVAVVHTGKKGEDSARPIICTAAAHERVAEARRLAREYLKALQSHNN